MRNIVLLFLLSLPGFSAAISNEIILSVRLPSLDRLLLAIEAKHRAAVGADVFQVFHASAGVAPRYTITNFDRDPSAPYITFNLGMDLGKLFSIPAARRDAIVADRGRVTKTYGEIAKGIVGGRKILARIDTYEELRTNTTDFEKRMLYADKIYDLEKELVGIYERMIGLQLDMYQTAGVPVSMEGAAFDYEIPRLREVFQEEAGRGSSFMFRPPRYK